MMAASSSWHSVAVCPKNMVRRTGRPSPGRWGPHSYRKPIMSPCPEMWWLGISSIAAVGSCSRIAPHVAASSCVIGYSPKSPLSRSIAGVEGAT